MGSLTPASKHPAEAFSQERAAVLGLWGMGADLSERQTVELHRGLPSHKIAAHAFGNAAGSGRTLLSAPVAAFETPAHVADLISLWESGVQLHVSLADRFTRNARFAESDAAMRRGGDTPGPKLDGLPVVAAGVEQMRVVVASTPAANQLDASGLDPRLAAETALAAGFTSIRGGTFDALERAHDAGVGRRGWSSWAYVDRLVAALSMSGAIIHREVVSPQAAALMPPGNRCALLLVEAMMAAARGVKQVTLALGTNLHLIQDVAAIHVVRRLAAEYVPDTEITVALDGWAGPLPPDLSDAYAVLSLGATTAVFAKADALVLRQGAGDSRQAAAWARMLRAGFTMMSGQRLPEGPEFQLELAFAERECRAILDRVLDFGKGEIEEGAETAIDHGVLQIPGCSLAGRAGSALPIRDCKGAVRYLDPGQLPFDADIREFHSERVRARAGADPNAAIGLMLNDRKLADMEIFA